MTRVERFFVQQGDGAAVLIHRPENIRYFSGYTGEGALLIHPKGSWIITDFRYTEQAERQAPGCTVEKTASDRKFEAIVRELVDGLGVDTVRIEDDFVTVKAYERLKEALAGIAIEGVGEGLTKTRMVKDADEIDAIRRAAAITDRAFEYICTRIAPGVTEWDLKVDLDFFFMKNGAQGPSFPAIIASGENGSLPHAEPGARKLRQGDLITFDFGCMVDGYCSDFTRTVALGQPCDELRRVYDIVLEAQLAGLASLAPGASCKSCDDAARDVIAAAGYGDRFGHSLGHGVGLMIHEGPGLASSSQDTLQPGMVVTVEPGIYLPGVGGVRIEDLVLITDTGIDVLSKSSKAYTQL